MVVSSVIPLISGNKVSAQISKQNDIDFYSINTANLNQLNIKFDIGPAAATFIISILGLFRFIGFTGTGFA